MVDNFRVLNLASNDYANMSHNNARALRSVEVHCDDFVLNMHPFGYKSQSQRIARERIKDVIFNFDCVQIFHTCPVMLELVLASGYEGKIIVYHSGSRYRSNPEHWNDLFNKYVYRCITDQTEFMELGAKDIAYLAPHVDLKPVPKRKDGKLIIGHYPSNPEVKGTKEIREMLEPFKDDFEIRIDETILPHEENLKRIGECHIYIELFKPELDGKPYGCFGVTAFEATALGCVVITNDLHPITYFKSYGQTPFIITNSNNEFNWQLSNIYKKVLDYNTLSNFFNNHSIESTGERILSLIR